MGEKTYGAFNWGDTRIVMLDCGEDKEDGHREYFGLNNFTSLRKEQAEFLKKEVASKAFKRAKKRVLIHHIPVYGMSEGAYNPSLDEWGSILKDAPFDIAINGHMHQFTYHPKNSVGNNFPIVIGGGPNIQQGAVVMVLKKEGNKMTLQVLDAKGEEKLKLEL
jgi:2',3'-cyclic-nucleotide 2'-phosphodiesterase (5'-nucleotidase family)